MDNFTKRNKISTKRPSLLIALNDVPLNLRYAIIQTLLELDYSPKFIREVLCPVLKIRPEDNYKEKYIQTEINRLMDSCSWNKVYDFCESFWDALEFTRMKEFENALNECLDEAGAVWQMESGKIIYKGDDNFESNIHEAEKVLDNAKLHTAKNEIKLAIEDISKKPEPDVTGAIQHCGAALECVAREICNDSKATFGTLLNDKKNMEVFPEPIKTICHKIWGFTSENGRHIKEGAEPLFIEAELIVGLSACLCSFLVKSSPKFNNSIEDESPF